MPSKPTDGLRRPEKDPISLSLHWAHRWEPFGYRIWCVTCNVPLYLGFLPPHRVPEPCEPGACPMEDGPLGLYRRCPRCFAVEWLDTRKAETA